MLHQSTKGVPTRKDEPYPDPYATGDSADGEGNQKQSHGDVPDTEVPEEQ